MLKTVETVLYKKSLQSMDINNKGEPWFKWFAPVSLFHLKLFFLFADYCYAGQNAAAEKEQYKLQHKIAAVSGLW